MKNRNYCMDFMKGIICLLVPLAHCEFPGLFGDLVQCSIRFAIPFFFMVSGYFFYSEKGPIKYGKKIKHIALITLFATIFYLIVALIEGNVTATWMDVVNWIVFNDPFIIVGQMWFLFTLLYVYIVFSLIDKLKLYKISIIMIPVLLVIFFILAHGLHFAGIDLPNYYYRNWLFEGLPLFSLGYWIRRKQDQIHVSNKLLIIVFIICTILCPIEVYLTGRDFSLNLMSIFQTLPLFLLAVNNPDKFKNSPLTTIGLKYSLYVYILHPAIWHLLDWIYGMLHFTDSTIMMYLRPIFCVGFSLLASIGVYHIVEKIKSAKKRSARA